jgi:DNA (cytosine-5)-methyltransferase 1
MKTLKHIELFAGCGGMSLGLESAGFELYFANELSPMASETFAYNILNENLSLKAKNKELPSNTIWIKSKFPKTNLTDRLRENPFEAHNGKYTDITADTNLKDKLLVGDINQLLSFLEKNENVYKSLRKQDIDLLSGGPPCQSFSLAGKREKNNHKNTLPLSFAKISGLIRPKVILLENVKGITAPFTEDGEKHYAWLEVSKAFVLEGFVPICMMVNSKYYGVAQNRPRFILFAFRKDIFDKIKTHNKENKLIKSSEDFYKLVTKNKMDLDKVTIKDFKFYDIETNPELFDGKILPKLTHTVREFITTSEAIGDIRRTQLVYKINNTKGKFANLLNDTFKKEFQKEKEIKNHEPRNHDFMIRSRFRFYQVIEQFQNGLKKGAVDLFTGKPISEEIREKLLGEFSHHNLLFKDKEKREVLTVAKNIKELETLVKSIPSKKHSQRALREFEPAPAQLTIPDDLCHYDSEQPRTLTVREMARFQSFPDWFEFRSKVTTGGDNRKFEVPQYTQVGNAVPPLLAKALGETIVKLLDKIK